MTTKEYLSQYKLLDNRINYKIEQVERLRRLATNVSPLPPTLGSARSTSVSDRVGKLVERIISLEESINRDIDKLVEKHNAEIKREEKRVAAEELADASDKLATALKHFGKGKLKFNYVNDEGQKRVVREDGRRRDVTTKVL